MQIKAIILLAGALAGASSVMAQDKIMKHDGEVIDAKVKSVGTRAIIYSKYNNPSGPEYTIGKNEVAKIKYENGGEDDFGGEWRMRPHRHVRPMQRGEQPQQGEQLTTRTTF